MCEHLNETSSTHMTRTDLTINAILSVTLAVIGTVGNGISIILVIRGRLHKNSTAMMLLLDLCGANLINTALILPLIAINSVEQGWLYGSTFCSAFGFIVYVNVTSECFILMIITVNQYLVIVRNLSSKPRMGIKLATALIIPWVISSIIYLFPLTRTWDEFGFDQQKGYCTLVKTTSSIFSVKSTLSFATIVTATVVIVYCYTKIYWTHHKSQRKTVNPSLSEAAVRFWNNARNAQLVRMITVILFNFLLTYIPFLVMTAADPCLNKTPKAVYTTIIFMSWSHSTTNPVIYALVNRQIQAQWRRLLSCLKRRTMTTSGHIKTITIIDREASLTYNEKSPEGDTVLNRTTS